METDEITVYEQRDGSYSFLPFWLPKGKSGKCEIHHDIAKKGSKLTVVSMRNAIFMGLREAKMTLEHDTIIHRLSEEDVSEQWITTLPQELEQHQRQLHNAHGNVLVGGLGIGIAVGELQRNPKVESITVVEINHDVITLVWPWAMNGYKKRHALVCADLNEWLKHTKRKFDFAFYDTWCPTGQFTYVEHVLPLRQASKGIVPQDMIECWNEDEMIGQIAMSINNWVGPGREHIRALMKEHGDPFDLSAAEFMKWAKCSTGATPFLCWLHENQGQMDAEDTEREAGLYIRALKDAVMYDKVWRQYENYGKESK